jgi:hypothetical protein
MLRTLALAFGSLLSLAAGTLGMDTGEAHSAMPAGHAWSVDTQLPERAEAARELVPLLNGIERRVSSRIKLEPGELMPSPYSGSRGTLFAFRIVDGRARLDERVREAIDRLLAWHKAPGAGGSPATGLADVWMDHLVLKVGGMAEPGPGQRPGMCDVTCTVSSLLDPPASFGRTGRERQEARDWILLDALAEAVEELEPGR